MSALDRAFIKAYAKDTPAASTPLPAVAATAALPVRTAARMPQVRPAATQAVTGSQVIDQDYRDGTLYRVEAPAARVPQRVEVPAPHFRLPPRSSPRRAVRRLVLKLFGPDAQPQLPEAVEAPSPPIRRPSRTNVASVRHELPPEGIDNAPQAEPWPAHAPPITEPNLPPSAPPVPLNQLPPEFYELPSQFEVQGHWDGDTLASDAPQCAASLVVFPEPADLELTEPAPLVQLRLDSLPEPAPVVPQGEIQPPETAPAAATFRLDPPHAETPSRPHARFARAAETDSSKDGPQSTLDVAEVAPAQPEPETISELELANDDEHSFADLEPSAAAATIAAAAEKAAPHCIPVWEVDRFQWPVTVERLVSTKGGYFGQAGERLVAAVGDGLRTLAVTGSRRGEGRTTLALCLARAAAKAGLQVAVVDADFARPQLAARIGLEITHGWQDAATGLIPLSEAAVKSLSDEMTVLPLEAASAAGQLSLADPRVTATLRAAAATFELVIVDLGPLATAEDQLFPADEACPFDAAIVVRDLRWASAAESEGVGERLYAAGVEAVGVAENFAPADEDSGSSA
jgi:Mrp family chromosome partitioning ATPase